MGVRGGAPAARPQPLASPVVDGGRGNWWWKQPREGSGRAVIFDVDGVLSDAAGRQHLLDGGRADWDAFFAACGEDPVIEEVARLLTLLERDLVVVLLTARPARVAPETLAWLRRADLRWDLLVMRVDGDYRSAREYKRRSVAELRDAGLEPALAFEDDRRNVAMFHEEGVPCVYLHSGYYD